MELKCMNCQKRKKDMITMIAKLTDNEILFCERWEQVAKRKWDIKTTDLEYCYNLVFNDKMTNNCPDCLRRYASQVNNYYNTILGKWNEYKIERDKPVEKVVPKTDVKKTDVIKKQVVKKKIVVKAPDKTSKKKVVKKDDNINTI